MKLGVTLDVSVSTLTTIALSDVVMAKIVGLKVGKFSLGPKPRRNSVELGSVMVGSGDALRESLGGRAALRDYLPGQGELLPAAYRLASE